MSFLKGYKSVNAVGNGKQGSKEEGKIASIKESLHEMQQEVERVANETGKPPGVKLLSHRKESDAWE